MDQAGQAAIEYLLIVALVIAVVVIIVVWNQSFSSNVEDTTINRAGNVICVTTECTDDSQCKIPACGGDSGRCDIASGFCQTGP